MSNAINWFELPSNNFERAVKFYSEVLGENLQPVDHPEMKMAFFPTQDKGVGGCVVKSQNAKPSEDGTLVYLNGGDDLAQPLSRVEEAGGTVIMSKTAIGENGFMAVFKDTEGNRVAFHSMS